jgi:secernin
MCDTFVATPDVTIDNVTIFAKNSDREPNEAQYLELIPAQDFPTGSHVQCTYIQIPQVNHTNAVLLSKPFWIWGAEMGVNEHNVAIGNEAVFTKVPYTKEKSLIGMDLLRLGLERGHSAQEALQVILSLLKEYGQGGNCGFQHKLYYHNSFLIADPKECWILETAGPHWAAKQVKGTYAISNGLSLSNQIDMASPELISNAIQKGWCKEEQDFDFARCYSDFIYTRFSDSRKRRETTTRRLSSRQGEMTVLDAMQILRDHGNAAGENWSPDKGIMGANVCMHASFGPIRGSQTVASLVAFLHPEQPTFFVTATAAPCTSVFKPIWLEAGLPDLGTQPEGFYDKSSLFWRHETLHRATLLDYSTRIKVYEQERKKLEEEIIATALNLANHSSDERFAYSRQCFQDIDEAEANWLASLKKTPIKNPQGFLHSQAWNTFNRQAKMPLN